MCFAYARLNNHQHRQMNENYKEKKAYFSKLSTINICCHYWEPISTNFKYICVVYDLNFESFRWSRVLEDRQILYIWLGHTVGIYKNRFRSIQKLIQGYCHASKSSLKSDGPTWRCVAPTFSLPNGNVYRVYSIFLTAYIPNHSEFRLQNFHAKIK